jgi:predicted permease
MISQLRKLTWWVQRRRKEGELREELQFHLEEEADELRANGLLEDHARWAARRDLGNVTLLREDTRTLWTWTVLEQFVQDVRHAIRTLRRSPSFAAVAVLTIALGIGATTTVYSVVSAMLLRPLPYNDADRLVRIVENVPAEESPSGLALRTSAMKSDTYLWWRDQAKTLSSIAGILASEVTVHIDGDLRRLSAARVSPSLFTMLGTRPIAGRGLDAGDEHANVAVLSAAAWARWFSSDPDVVGRNVVLDGVSHTVVGVMSTAFALPSTHTEIWTPYVVEPNAPNRIITIDVVAKLRQGVSIAAASIEASIIGNSFLGLPPPGTAGVPNPARFEVIGLQDQLVEPIRPALQALMASVALVLLIVCANVANLLTAQGFARQRELGIRRALGAGRGRVVRQLLTESLVLSVAGGLVAIALAFGGLWLVKVFTAVTLPALYGGNSTLLPGIERVGIDTGVLTFALLAGVASGLVFGLMPALHLSRAALSLTAGHVDPSGISWARRGVGSILTVGQLAMATMLLVGGGLLIRTFVGLSRVDLGYNPANALTFELVLPHELEGSRKLALANELATRLASLPGVQAAGFTGAAPLSTMPGGWVLTPPGRTPAEVFSQPGIRVQASVVSPAYLRAIGARLVEGRWLDVGHGLDQPPALLVNRTLARRFFGDQSPLGLPVDIGGRRWQVAGVVEDMRSRGLDIDPEPRAYLDPVRMDADARAAGWEKFGFSATPLFLSFAARVTGDPGTLVADVRGLVRQLDQSAAIDGVIGMDQVVSGALARPRFYALLLGLFAGIAAVVAAVGTYGLLSYTVTRRTQELAIRMALGAQRAKVLMLVLGHGAILSTIGIALGLIGASAGARLLEGMLFGITPLDPNTFVAVTLMFGFVATVACYVPARRATTVDPILALRTE